VRAGNAPDFAFSDKFQIDHVLLRDMLGAPEGAGESEQQNCAVPQTLHVGVGQGGHLVGCGGVLRAGRRPSSTGRSSAAATEFMAARIERAFGPTGVLMS
jgi:hypothetical protein